jgi:formylglycine-generating enzyme required for sulfatase activity
MEFVLVPAGNFVAGSPSSEAGHQSDEVLYPVQIAKSFYVAAHEVTAGQWAAVMQPGAPPLPDDEAALPVVNVTWHDARQFVDRLNQGQPWRLRLPSEVEWEYACRAGTTTPYSTGQYLSTEEANYNGEFPTPGQAAGENRRRASRVGSFAPNAWGLFDMHGNVWEWTNDAYDEAHKVIRGGSWRFNADSARCALRYTHRPQDRGDSLGLRLVRDLTREERSE